VQDIAEMDSDAEQGALIFWPSGIELLKRDLDLNGRFDGRQASGEFDQEAIADGLDLATVMTGDAGSDDRAVFLKQLQRQRLVSLAKRGKTDHVGEHDGC
jgi:hypothetical protein